MKVAPAEMFRMIAVFFMVMFLLNFGIIGWELNQENDYESMVSQKIAKEGCVNERVITYANHLSHNTRYRGMFTVKAAPNDRVHKKDINGHDRNKMMTINYSQPQNYGNEIKYIIGIHITPFALGSGSWTHLPGIDLEHEGLTTSQLAKHNPAQSPQPFD